MGPFSLLLATALNLDKIEFWRLPRLQLCPATKVTGNSYKVALRRLSWYCNPISSAMRTS